MLNFDQLQLSKLEKLALAELRTRLLTQFSIVKIIIFGSAARNQSVQESDLDLVLIAEYPLSFQEKYAISDLVCDINLHYETNLSILIVDQASWDHGSWSLLPLKKEVLQDGVVYEP